MGEGMQGVGGSSTGGIERWRSRLEMKRRPRNTHRSETDSPPLITLCADPLAPSAQNTAEQVTLSPTQHTHTHHLKQQCNHLTCVCTNVNVAHVHHFLTASIHSVVSCFNSPLYPQGSRRSI